MNFILGPMGASMVPKSTHAENMIGCVTLLWNFHFFAYFSTKIYIFGCSLKLINLELKEVILNYLGLVNKVDWNYGNIIKMSDFGSSFQQYLTPKHFLKAHLSYLNQVIHVHFLFLLFENIGAICLRWKSRKFLTTSCSRWCESGEEDHPRLGRAAFDRTTSR